MSDSNKNFNIKLVQNLKVSAIDGSFETSLPYLFTRSENSWPFTKDDLITKEDVLNFSYLQKVPFQFYDAEVDRLIGMNMPQLVKPLEIVDSDAAEPFAAKYSLGWAFCGPLQRTGKKIKCNKIVSDSNEINNLINEYFCSDYKDSDPIQKEPSHQDKIWLEKG